MKISKIQTEAYRSDQFIVQTHWLENTLLPTLICFITNFFIYEKKNSSCLVHHKRKLWKAVFTRKHHQTYIFADYIKLCWYCVYICINKYCTKLRRFYTCTQSACILNNPSLQCTRWKTKLKISTALYDKIFITKFSGLKNQHDSDTRDMYVWNRQGFSEENFAGSFC